MCVVVDVTDGVCVCVQLGGTVGDIESMPFIEAFRQFQFKVKRENFCNIHVSLIPQVRERHLQAVSGLQSPLTGWASMEENHGGVNGGRLQSSLVVFDLAP